MHTQAQPLPRGLKALGQNQVCFASGPAPLASSLLLPDALPWPCTRHTLSSTLLRIAFHRHLVLNLVLFWKVPGLGGLTFLPHG